MLRTPERPITSFKEDQFGLKPFINQISSTLVKWEHDRWHSTGSSISLTGQWGTGKSSILNLMAEALNEKCEKNIVVVRFNPWLVTNRDELIYEFLNELRANYSTWLVKHSHFPGVTPWESRALARNLDRSLAKYAKLYANLAKIAAGTLAPGSGPIVGEFISSVFDNSKVTLSDQKGELEKCISKIGLPLVVLVDEMDRVEDTEIRTMAQVVKAIADMSNISFLLAFDKLRVVEALSYGQKLSGEEYLEKIVGYTIEVPSIMEGQEKSYLKDFFENMLTPEGFEDVEDINERLTELLFIMPDGLLSVRDLKRVAAAVDVRNRMVDGEVDPVDLLAWCILEAKTMTTTEQIKKNYKHLVCDYSSPNDLSKEIMAALDHEIGSEGKLRKILSEHMGIKKKWVLDTLVFLFDRSHLNPHTYEAPTRISYRQPFLTLTRGGIAPTRFTKRYLEQIVSNPNTLMEELAENSNDNKTQELFDAIRRYYPMNNHAEQHEEFIYKLALAIESNAPEPRAWKNTDHFLTMTSQAGEIIAGLPRKTYEYVLGTKNAIERLLDMGLIIIPAAIAHRMPFPNTVDEFADDKKDPLANIRELKTIVEEAVVKRYSEPKRLSEVHSFAPLYFLNSLDKKYDKLMLEIGDKIIRDQSARESFIFEGFRTNHYVSSDYLEKLFPLDHILGQIETFIKNADRNNREQDELYQAMKHAQRMIRKPLP